MTEPSDSEMRAPHRARSWRRRLLFGLPLAVLTLHGCERLLDEITQGRVVAYGAACTKPYLPHCQPRVFRGTNFLHYRDDEPERPKPEGMRRIFVTGGSTTFKPIDSGGYPTKLEALFARDSDCPPVHVMNASLDGYDVVASAAQIRHEVGDPDLGLEVDVVLASEQWNFLMSEHYAPQLDERSPLVGLLGRVVPFLKYPIALEMAFGFLDDEASDDPDLFVALAPQADAYMRFLQAGREAAGRAGALYVQGLHPDRWGEHGLIDGSAPGTIDLAGTRVHIADLAGSVRFKKLLELRIREHARANAIPLIDWAERFEALERESLFEADGIHPNADGATHMAVLAYQVLKPLVCD